MRDPAHLPTALHSLTRSVQLGPDQSSVGHPGLIQPRQSGSNLHSAFCASCSAPGSCNMAGHAKPININGLQEFAVSQFMKMGIKQVCKGAQCGVYMELVPNAGANEKGRLCCTHA